MSSPFIGLFLTTAAFVVGKKWYQRYPYPIFHPLLTAVTLIIVVIQVSPLTYGEYQTGAGAIAIFLSPATAALAYSVYQQKEHLKQDFWPICFGSFVGAVTSIFSVTVLANWFGLDKALRASLLPKSVTTPIAMELSEQMGGVPSITAAAVLLTGLLGAMFAPTLLALLHISDATAAGTAIGVSSHAVGTSKAIELGEAQGAASSIAIATTGLITVFIALFFL